MVWPCCLPCTRLQVTQQCRPEDIDAVRQRYAAHDIPAELGTYFEDMAERLADAHLFIGRSGADHCRLTAVGRPAILVPLPIATDDHQAANAREMVASGGARSIRQEKFTAVELAKQIQALAQRPDPGQCRPLRVELRAPQRRRRSGRSGRGVRRGAADGCDPRGGQGCSRRCQGQVA
jgi:UDP-N-acetylglucosamine:LPS N-acetylglucosamine transferase